MASNDDGWVDVPVASAAPHKSDDGWEDVPVGPPLPKAQKTSVGDALMRGAAQGATLGFADEASARVNTVRDYLAKKYGLQDMIGGKPYKGWDDNVAQNLDMIRGRDQVAKDEHPVANVVGGIGGALATAPLLSAAEGLPVVGKVAAAINPAARTSKWGRIGAGAAMGGVAGAGESDYAPTKSFDDLKGFGKDVGKGVAIGGATQGILDKVLPGIGNAVTGALPDKLKDIAERRAFKAAVGNQAKFMDEVQKQGRVNAIGRDLLDDGVVGFGDKARSIADKADIARKAVGGEMSDLFGKVDQALPGSAQGPQIAAKLRAYASGMQGEGNQPVVNKLLDLADSYEGKGPINLAQAAQEKASFKYRPGDPGQTFDKEANNRVKGIIGDEMENAVGRYDSMLAQKAQPAAAASMQTGTGPVSNIPLEGSAVLGDAEAAGSGARDAYEAMKSRYGSFATAGKAAEKLANRQEKNATFGLLPTITGAAGIAAGAAHGSPMMALGGAGLGVAHKVLRERGSSAMAVSADKLADVLQATPQVFGKYAGPLAKAAERGNQSLAATHFVLDQSDPAYREKHKEIFGSGDSQP